MNRKTLSHAALLLALTSLGGCGGNGSSPSHAIGGAINGLTGTVVLQNNGRDDLTVTATTNPTSFTFPIRIADGASYDVTVLTQPAGQLCTPSANSGIVNGADVTDVTVTCVNAYKIGGSLSGLGTGVSIALQNNGGDNLTLSADGTFAFSTLIADGATYDVTIVSQPGGQECVVTNNSGFVSGADVSDVLVGNCIVVAPPAPEVTLAYAIKELQFSWDAVGGATYYRVFEDPDGASGYTQVGGDLTSTTFNHEITLYRRVNAHYKVQACNSAGCTDSTDITLADHLASAVGYMKASNTGAGDMFGIGVALSGDGTTLAVGAYNEDSAATGVDGDGTDDTSTNSGAVYIFTHAGSDWSQQAYLKASNTGAGDEFGFSIALSNDGNTLAVGAPKEDSAAVTINGDETSNGAVDSGAVYIFSRSGTDWSQQAYVKATNTGAGDVFGSVVVLSSDGNNLAVGAPMEDSSASGIGGDGTDDTARDSGAAYVFTRSGTTWSQEAYVKASNTGADDRFGGAVALSGDGNTLAIGARREDSAASGIGGLQTDNSQADSGALYLFARSGTVWSQQAYIKASNTGAGDMFGYSAALSSDGNTLAVGAWAEGSSASGIDGDSADNSAAYSGAAYVFTRSGTDWVQEAYVKASNTGATDRFGSSLALSADGNTLAVGAYNEDSLATGIDGEAADQTDFNSGAIYLFTRAAAAWSQQAYVKAPNTGGSDAFGRSISLSADGNTLVAGAYNEDSAATGVGGDLADNTISDSGAVYLY